MSIGLTSVNWSLFVWTPNQSLFSVTWGILDVEMDIIVRADLKHCHKSYGVIKVFSLTTKILTSDRPSARALQGNIGPRSCKVI